MQRTAGRRLFPANTSYDDFSNTGTPQNRDSYESVAVGCVQLLLELGAILLDCFYTYLQLRGDLRGCFAVTKQPKNLGFASA